MLRYIRQIALSEIGIVGQKKLASSSVLIVGIGALGSPSAIYLAAAGVGTIGIVDDDNVQLDNLHRQILHATVAVGKPKTESAKETIAGLNPDIKVNLYQERLTAENAIKIFGRPLPPPLTRGRAGKEERAGVRGYDVILDCSDNFSTRYVVNSACVKLGLPFVHGSILRFEGQVSVFNKGDSPHSEGGLSPCYSCLYPEPPPIEISPTCARAGVLGAVTGIIGSMQALEAIKLICGFGEPLIGKLLIFDGLTCKVRLLEVKKDEKCKVCGEIINDQAPRNK